jgi:hypothetical protein
MNLFGGLPREEDKMETKLWALLVPGPDDLWPMPSHEAADEAAQRHNKIVDADNWPYPELRESSRARVIEWPYGAESHTKIMESGEAEVLSSNDLRIPDGVVDTMGLTPNA